MKPRSSGQLGGNAPPATIAPVVPDAPEFPAYPAYRMVACPAASLARDRRRPCSDCCAPLAVLAPLAFASCDTMTDVFLAGRRAPDFGDGSVSSCFLPLSSRLSMPFGGGVGSSCGPFVPGIGNMSPDCTGRRRVARRRLRGELRAGECHLGFEHERRRNVFFFRRAPRQAVAGRNFVVTRVGRVPFDSQAATRRIVGRVVGDRADDDGIDAQNLASRRASAGLERLIWFR